MARFSDAQIGAIILGSRAFRVYDFPGHPDVKVAVRSLSETEANGVEVAALHELEDAGKARKWSLGAIAEAAPDFHQRFLQVQTIFRALYDPETIEAAEPVRFFKSAKELAELDAGIVTKLWALYLEHQEWVNPLLVLDEAGAEELAAAAKKDPTGGVIFSGYDRSTLVRLLIALLSRPSTT